MQSKVIRPVVALAALPLFAAAASPAAAAVTLIPHRAVYELSLTQNRGASGVEQVRGRIVYQFTGDACAGYALNFRQVTEIVGGEGQSNVSDLRAETWEDAAGKSFRFSGKNFLNDELERTTDGKAERKADAVRVDIEKPKPLSSRYEAGILFPTGHITKIIEAAERRDTLLEAAVYDGSETGEKSFDTLSVIGKPVVLPKEALEAAAAKPGIEGEASWPVSVSYFERGKKTDGEQTPDYLMSFDLYANGVSRDLKIDYGDFVLTGALKELKYLKRGECKR